MQRYRVNMQYYKRERMNMQQNRMHMQISEKFRLSAQDRGRFPGPKRAKALQRPGHSALVSQ